MKNRIEIGQRGKNFGVLCFYEPINDATMFQMETACAQIPEQALLSEKKMFSVYYEFEEYRHINDAENIIKEIIDEFKDLDWLFYKNQDYPDTQSGLCELVDTDNMKFANSKYANFEKTNVNGFNACRGILVVMYKDEPSPVNEEEQKQIFEVFKKYFEELE